MTRSEKSLYRNYSDMAWVSLEEVRALLADAIKLGAPNHARVEVMAASARVTWDWDGS